jgi:hypothetical protein
LGGGGCGSGDKHKLTLMNAVFFFRCLFDCPMLTTIMSQPLKCS